MINHLKDMYNNKAYEKLIQSLDKNQNVSVFNAVEGFYPFFINYVSEYIKKPIIFITTSDIKAAKYARDIKKVSGKFCTSLPSRDKQFGRIAASHESTWQRINVLNDFADNSDGILCMSIESAMEYQLPIQNIINSRILLKIGDVISPKKLIEKLIHLGFERVELVEGKGQFALRGDIFDVFPPNSSSAYRIEFFDDEVDSLRTFDCISQRSLHQVETVNISTATECLLSNESEYIETYNKLFKIISSIKTENEDEINNKKELLASINNLKAYIPFKSSPFWFNYIFEKHNIFNFTNIEPLIIIDNENRIKDRSEQIIDSFNTSLDNFIERNEAFSIQRNLLFNYDYLYHNYFENSHNSIIHLNNIELSSDKSFNSIDFNCIGVSGYKGIEKDFIKDINKYKSGNTKIIILSGSYSRANRLIKTFNDHDINNKYMEDLPNELSDKHVFITPTTLSTGFFDRNQNILVLSDFDIFGSSYSKRKKKNLSSNTLGSYTELSPGEFVVHEMYGVGLYQGITSITKNNATQEYLLIQYSNNDKLYVPTNQFDRVKKYSSGNQLKPTLSKLGGTEWKRRKSKVKAGIKKIAFDLIQLYAERHKNTGFAFSKTTPWESEFDDNFPFELTADQDRSVAEVYSDMESSRNMDRLLCGDVGYGKTEVALRAVFKAVMDNKQVAILAPTTILVQQHYNTILKRFKGFPVKCDMLSRFKNPKEQKAIIEKINAGELDIVVGTHRLLSKEIDFKNLGLLVIDEEQRFGVAHKEIIKNMKKNIDVLTLSATPIPRTLYMSMIGVRDVSVIETPPEDRLPVKTYVMEYDNDTIAKAIKREINRGGQIYFLYNRVDDIDKMAKSLKELVPEARIGIGHGQMPEKVLENVMIDFYNGTYDVLLCTTIIENGLDVPEANTLIIYNADRFGLSQLYQLRGRVGRSNRQAFAYFTLRPNYAVSETAQKRLDAIREFTEFGAGYRIATRDLEIRGAGNIFGAEQHGYMSNIGLDMYLHLIEQTMNELQGKASPEFEIETRINLDINAYLPNDYIKSEQQRIEMYKHISMITDTASKMDIEEELIDRYGNLPIEVENLTMISLLRALAKKLFVTQVKMYEQNIHMLIDEKHLENPEVFLDAIFHSDSRIHLTRREPYSLIFKSGQSSNVVAIKILIPILIKMNEYIDNKKN